MLFCNMEFAKWPIFALKGYISGVFMKRKLRQNRCWVTIFACSKCFLICIFRKINTFFSILDPENIDKFKKNPYLCVQEEILEKFK